MLRKNYSSSTDNSIHAFSLAFGKQPLTAEPGRSSKSPAFCEVYYNCREVKIQLCATTGVTFVLLTSKYLSGLTEPLLPLMKQPPSHAAECEQVFLELVCFFNVQQWDFVELRLHISYYRIFSNMRNVIKIREGTSHCSKLRTRRSNPANIQNSIKNFCI